MREVDTLGTAAAARWLGVAEWRLAQWRLLACAPPWTRDRKRRVRFPVDGLARWRRCHVVHRDGSLSYRVCAVDGCTNPEHLVPTVAP